MLECKLGFSNSSVSFKNLVCEKLDPINFENFSGSVKFLIIRTDSSRNYYIGMTGRKFCNKLRVMFSNKIGKCV